MLSIIMLDTSSPYPNFYFSPKPPPFPNIHTLTMYYVITCHTGFELVIYHDKIYLKSYRVITLPVEITHIFFLEIGYTEKGILVSCNDAEG